MRRIRALTLAAEHDVDAALGEIRAFHHRLCTVRVLDPACGSGNFLYVTLEHLKRLEGEVLNAFDELDPDRQSVKLRQGGLALEGNRADPFGGETVDPHQLLGIELNPRAAAIAELVLWIGYLQWHFRTRGAVMPPEPVLKDFRNIECRDAVLAWDRVDYATDAAGVPQTRWDGKTMKASPVTGEAIPDESARVPVEVYLNPRRAVWPAADFVVGNPPFIGNKRMRLALGDGYVEALRGVWPDVPESADFVMYWWHHAAKLTARGALRRFGLITTNSLRQTFNRRVVEAALAPSLLPPGEGACRADEGKMPHGREASTVRSSLPSSGAARHLLPEGEGKQQPLSLVFAIPDHPWVDAVDGAAVRIAMTVGATEDARGALLEVAGERTDSNGEITVGVHERRGLIHADLTIGPDTAGAKVLRSNAGLALRGMTLVGMGFVISRNQAELIAANDSSPTVIKPFFNGRDITQTTREAYVIDLFGLTVEEARMRVPSAYQWVFDRVKPERDQNARQSYREKWWLFAEARSEFREATKRLVRYIATPMTAKHRLFVWLPEGSVPDQGLVPIALDDAYFLGVLSARMHQTWALATGGTLEDRPRYNQSTCFGTFPFPIPSDAQQSRIRDLAEQLDAHRKRQQAAHSDLTLTGMYNVLEKLRSGDVLTAKERTIHEHGLVSVLRQLHDELDFAVLDAYGWSDLAPLLRVAAGHDTAAVLAPVGAAAAAMLSDARRTPSPPNPRLEGMDSKSIAAAAAPTTASPDAPTREDAARTLDEAILERLVALNAERAAEEKRGQVRWLRPAFQNPQGMRAPEQIEADTSVETAVPAAAKKQPWPKELAAQVRAVADALADAGGALDEAALAARFSARGRWRERLPTILDTLVAIGRARRDGDRYSAM